MKETKLTYFQNLEEVPKLKKLPDEPIFYHSDDCACSKCKSKTEKRDTMKKFKALRGDNRPIITVLAKDKKDAITKIREQLRCRRRIEFFEAWVIGGFKIEESEIVRGDHYGAINPELLKETR